MPKVRLQESQSCKFFSLFGHPLSFSYFYLLIAFIDTTQKRPIIRSKLSMGKLDVGGSRGECAGLFFLLDDIANTIASMYGSLLRSSEGMFAHDDAAITGKSSSSMEVDLVVSGVWVPVATALMTDPGIKTAIFSPGIANVLQVRAFTLRLV